MLTKIKNEQWLSSLFISLFFILLLQFKWSYTVFPILLSLLGLIAFWKFKNKIKLSFHSKESIIALSFIIYFSLFLLSMLIHSGKVKELDLPIRALLVLPIFMLFGLNKALFFNKIIYSILLGAILSGIVAIIQVFILHFEHPFPNYMHIQAGDIAMSLALFSFCILFYAYTQSYKLLMILSGTAGLLALIASLLTTARGAWVGLPLLFAIIFYFNRKIISKKLIFAILSITILGGVLSSSVIKQRFIDAQSDITQYIEQNNGSTSVGARFDMWKSALLGIQEKPLFGWGLEGVKEMRKQHFEKGYISELASSFAHSHNQFLHDASVRGILGLGALLAIFLIPLSFFIGNLRTLQVGTLAHLWNLLGVVHIVATMSYCMSQSFLAHNSGVMFYFFLVVVFWGLQKVAKIRPLEAQN